jgi:hypothetical protein
MQRMSLQRRQLSHCNRESSNSKSEHHNRGPGPHPGKKRSFVGEMISRPIGIGLRTEMGTVGHKRPSETPALFHSLGKQRARTGKILRQLSRKAMTLTQVLGIVVGNGYLT